jgi:hypothetical protein
MASLRSDGVGGFFKTDRFAASQADAQRQSNLAIAAINPWLPVGKLPP